MFTEKEITYVKSQRLARLGTVSADSQPDVSPVGYEFDGESFFIGGMNNPATRKYKNVAQGNTLVALAIDDIVSEEPWVARGLKVYGTADIVERKGYAGGGSYLRVRPSTTWSWGVDGPVMEDGKFKVNKTEW